MTALDRRFPRTRHCQKERFGFGSVMVCAQPSTRQVDWSFPRPCEIEWGYERAPSKWLSREPRCGWNPCLAKGWRSKRGAS